MDIRKLTPLFYAENTGLKEVLDCTLGAWIANKTRGYGIAIISINSLCFGIPLRSHVRHKHAFLTNPPTKNGLDYSKAVLLSKPSYISTDPFMIPSEELKKINGASSRIRREFEKYVQRYIDAHAGNNTSLIENEYRFTTLINYHVELGIAVTVPATQDETASAELGVQPASLL